MRYEVVRGALRSARPVVALHGFLGTPAAWAALALEGDVAAGVLPGHGPSPWLPDGASFLDVAAAMARAVPFDEPAVLVGYSMGGRLALAMAALEPARFAHVVVVGANPGLTGAAERAERTAWDDSQAERLLGQGLASFVASWEALPLFATQRTLSREVLEAQRRERLTHTERGLAFAMRALGLGRMPPAELERSTLPVTAVAGALDARHAELAARIAREAPRGRASIVPGVGHNVLLEASQALGALVRKAMTQGAETEDGSDA